MKRLFIAALFICAGSLLWAEVITSYALSLHGEPMYPENFTHFDYVDPDAPQGGTLRMYAIGTYDNFHPYALRGDPAGSIDNLYDSLMTGSSDEADVLYPLIAEKAEYSDDYSWVIFHINPAARFQDGAPITADAIGYMPNNRTHSGFNTVSLFLPERSQWLATIVDDIFMTYQPMIHLTAVNKGPFYGHSGNRAYDDYGFATLKFFEGITNQGWEKPPHTNDTLSMINFSYLTNVIRLIIGSLATYADMEDQFPEVSINSPREDTIFLNNVPLSFFPLSKGRTIMIGDFTVQVEVQERDGPVQRVEFELLRGDNDVDISTEVRPIVASYMHEEAPFEWEVTTRLFGSYTLRATVIDENNHTTCDDIEILAFNI